MNQHRGGRDQRGGSRGRDGGRSAAPASPPLFDPGKDRAELLDDLAEQQAKSIGEISSSQLRRFFGEAKDLYRRLETGARTREERAELFKTSIEPEFRMMRSKASYASRPADRGQPKIPPAFHTFIENGVKKVKSVEDFTEFIQHFEAVVGFMYGKGLCRKN